MPDAPSMRERPEIGHWFLLGFRGTIVPAWLKQFAARVAKAKARFGGG
jgi:hypothetical protein